MTREQTKENEMSNAKPALQILPDDDHGPELIAKSIEEVADAAKKLLNSRLHRRAILLLIKDNCGAQAHIGMGDIEKVLEAAAGLRKYVVKPK
jgi:predicted metal-dependent hydrolase